MSAHWIHVDRQVDASFRVAQALNTRAPAEPCERPREQSRGPRMTERRHAPSDLICEADVEPRSDERLLEQYLEGDRAAFQELMGRYADELLNFLTRFLGARAAAEDVFQETFLQIHISADTFDSTRRFKPWLFTIAANKARDYHRKHHKRPQVSLTASVSDEEEGSRYVDLLEADLPGPEAPILDAERSRLVKQVIDGMPAHLREILLMSYFQKMSYNQISEALEIPLGTVKSRLHTAVANFASAWKAARVEERIADGCGENEKGDKE